MRGQERGDAAGGEADGGFVDAEDLAEQPVGHAQPQVAGGGGHDGLEREPCGAAAAGLAAAAAAVQVQPLLAGRGERDGHRGEQGGQVGDAGQGGEGGQAGAGIGRRGRVRFRAGRGDASTV